MDNLKVGSKLFKVNYSGGYGQKTNIVEVEITGETKTRWKVGEYTQLLKEDLSVYGNGYNRNAFMIEAPARLIEQNKAIDKANDFKRLLEAFTAETRREIDFTDKMTKIYEILKEG